MRYFSVVMLAVLSACAGGEVKETLGLGRKAPDEFAVVSRPPLSVPREFYLRPPTTGEAGEFGTAADRQARALVTGTGVEAVTVEEAERGLVETAATPVLSGELPSAAESNLLGRAGAQEADPTIRDQLYQENVTIRANEPDMIDRLRGDTHVEPVVDAKEEATRIRENVDAGKPVTEGEVRTTTPGGKSTLERIFE